MRFVPCPVKWMLKLQWGEGSCPSALGDVSREMFQCLEWPTCVIPGLTPVLTPWPWTTKVQETPSRHRQLLSKEGNSSPVWVCLAVQGFKGCYIPESSMVIFPGAAFRDWQNKAILLGWIHTKVYFSDPMLKFPKKTAILTAQVDIGTCPPVLVLQLHKGQSFKAAPHAFRKIWGCNRRWMRCLIL